MQCPRRAESWVGTAEFAKREDDTGPDGKCTYCGSLSPEQFFAAIEEGKSLSPTDKNYKVYVEGIGGTGKFYFQHLNEAEKRRFIELLNAKKITIGLPGHFYVLPFFISRDSTI